MENREKSVLDLRHCSSWHRCIQLDVPKPAVIAIILLNRCSLSFEGLLITKRFDVFFSLVYKYSKLSDLKEKNKHINSKMHSLSIIQCSFPPARGACTA